MTPTRNTAGFRTGDLVEFDWFGATIFGHLTDIRDGRFVMVDAGAGRPSYEVDFNDLRHPAHPLPHGTVLPQGVVRDETLTAYVVETPAGDFVFVPFVKVHPPVPATPLVSFQ